MRELEGKVAGVTGGSGRIGRGLAQRFLQAGMRVVLADLDVDGLKAAEQQLSAYGAVIGVPADLSKREHVEVLALRAVEEFGAVHVLCNDAGLNSRPEPALWELPYQEWQTVVGGVARRDPRGALQRAHPPRGDQGAPAQPRRRHPARPLSDRIALDPLGLADEAAQRRAAIIAHASARRRAARNGAQE